ncbi:MAG: magnesium/cobalt transporter CorA [Treponema sp.]|jgi:magnesium transporter|nr:magnesium/cobalt transporter CorA [Treponema sp.]
MPCSIIRYTPEEASLEAAADARELLPLARPGAVNWLNVETLDDKAGVEALAAAFNIHPLTVEDILDTEQRPKVEEFDHYLFITLKAINRRGRGGEPHPGDLPALEQISIVLTENTVITFQELPGDSFDSIRRRILNAAGRIRKMGSAYLAYAILDTIINDYFLVLDKMDERIETFEDRAIDEQDTDFISDLQDAKRGLLSLRRIIWPLREALGLLLHIESPCLPESALPFFKDLHDSVMQCAETTDTCRELLAGVTEVNLSSMSNRMNRVMKVLTIISTIFIPLTFIVGVYGMNFKWMPELEVTYAYPLVWGVMAFIVIGMILFFKKRGWL